MTYRVEILPHGREWTTPPHSVFSSFERADQAADRLWAARRRFGLNAVRLIDLARETVPDLDPVVLLMEQRRTR